MIRLKDFWYGVRKTLVSTQHIRKRATEAAAKPQIDYEKKGETKSTLPPDVRPYEEIPGPKPLPIIGNSFRFVPYIGEFGNASLMDQLQVLRDTYGDIVKLDGLLTRSAMVILYRPELTETVYRQQGVWPKRMMGASQKYYRDSRPEIYNNQPGLMINQGEEWYKFRSKVNPHMMQPRAIKPHISLIEEITDDLISRMLEVRDSRTLELPPSFNNILNKWALEGICSIALNRRLGCLNPNLSKDSEPQKVIDSTYEVFSLMGELDMKPGLWKFYNTPNIKKLFSVMDTLNSVAVKYVDLAKKEFQGKPTNTPHDRSLLEKLLSVDETIGRIMSIDMFMVGVDTTGNVAAAMMYYLASNPDKQEKLRKEAISIMPNKDSSVTYDSLSQSSYLKACIKETLRLFPIVEGIFRAIETDIAVGGYLIPKGTDIVSCHALMAIDPEQFARPQEFIPERWLKNDTEFPSAKNAHPFAYMPFGFGARNCVGKRFADMELEILALKLVRNFKMEWHHGPLERKRLIVNTVTTPLEVKITEL